MSDQPDAKWLLTWQMCFAAWKDAPEGERDEHAAMALQRQMEYDFRQVAGAAQELIKTLDASGWKK